MNVMLHILNTPMWSVHVPTMVWQDNLELTVQLGTNRARKIEECRNWSRTQNYKRMLES